MARYVDANKMLEFLEETNANYHWLLNQYNASWISDFIESQPTADVVPKSEVAKLERAVQYLEGVCESLPDKVRAEVAREIFEEIEALMLDGKIGGKYPAKVINPDKFAELKKKYTGE